MAYTEPDLKRPELGRTDVTSTTEADHDENGREEQRGTVDTKSVVKHKTHKNEKSEERIRLGTASEGESQCGSCHGRLGGQAGRPAGAVLSVGCRKPSSRKGGGRRSKAVHTLLERSLFYFFLKFEKNKIKIRPMCSV